MGTRPRARPAAVLLMLCLPGFLSTGNSKTSTDAAEPIGETLAAKLEAEGLAALQNGEALSIYARPYCERASYFQCHRSDGSSFHGRALVQKAVAKLGAALSADANSQRRRWMLSEAQLHAGNLTGALEHLLSFVRAARINEASKHHGEDPLAGLETFDTDPWGGTTGPGHVGWLPTALTDIHVFGTRGAHLAQVEPVQQEILRQHQYGARAFPAMHFVEIPGVTGRMAFTNSRRLHELAKRALPQPGDRPPAPRMSHLHHQLMLPSSGVKTLTIGLVCAKGFGDSHTTRALLGVFLARKRRPWRGPDGRRMTTSCYAPQPDDGSDIRRLWALRGCDAFVAAHDMSAPDLSRRIQRDRTHLLVDLHGYSLGHASVWAQVFQLHSAPVQAHFHGQPLTTGSPLMDWYVSDKVSSPPELSQHYAEHLALLPSCYLCNSLAAMEHTRQLWAPSSAPAPALSRPASQTVTRHAHGLAEQDLVMGYFGQTYKIEKAILECWVAILKQVPRARLWLFFFPIQPVRTWEDVQTNLVDAARAMGLRNASARIVVSDLFPRDVEFETKRLADVYLDTHTFSSHTTAADAMWAGLPVVTAPGEVHVSRVAAALAMSEGAQPLVARSLEDYLSLVVALLRAPGKLRRLKQSIRGRLAAPSQPPLVSPLWDVTYFAEALDCVLRLMADVAAHVGARRHVLVSSQLRSRLLASRGVLRDA